MLSLIVFTVLIFLASAAAILRQEHMFQLNSYKPRVHLKRTLTVQPKSAV